MSYVASNLKFLRKQTGLSQDLFAARLELNRGNIASYEKGSAEPSVDKIVKFAAFFNIDVASFIQKDLSGAAINTMPGMNGGVAVPQEQLKKTVVAIDWEGIESEETITSKQFRKDISYMSKSLERIAVAVEALLKINKEMLRRQTHETEITI